MKNEIVTPFLMKLYYLLLLLLPLFIACSKSSYADTELNTVVPTLTGFAPTSGHAGSVVVLKGTNFSQTVASNAVSIGGVEATVISASSTEIKVVAPEGIAGGKIVIISNGSAITSVTNYTVLRL